MVKVKAYAKRSLEMRGGVLIWKRYKKCQHTFQKTKSRKIASLNLEELKRDSPGLRQRSAIALLWESRRQADGSIFHIKILLYRTKKTNWNEGAKTLYIFSYFYKLINMMRIESRSFPLPAPITFLSSNPSVLRIKYFTDCVFNPLIYGTGQLNQK